MYFSGLLIKLTKTATALKHCLCMNLYLLDDLFCLLRLFGIHERFILIQYLIARLSY
jgi:hypothetical protein